MTKKLKLHKVRLKSEDFKPGGVLHVTDRDIQEAIRDMEECRIDPVWLGVGEWLVSEPTGRDRIDRPDADSDQPR